MLIVGAGLAGLSAAVAAADAGVEVTVWTKVHPTASHSAAATGGINAALGPDDSAAEHVADTLRAADGLADRAAVETVCGGAAVAVHRLDRLGVPFDRDADGRLGIKPLGGSSRARTVFAGGHTGRAMVEALWERAVALGVRIEYPVRLLDLLVDDRCRGAVGLRLDTGAVVSAAGPVVLATGGLGRIYGTTTNAAINTGDGVAAALRAGVRLRDMEFTQFYPTAFVGSGICVTEEVRTLGATLVDDAGERFMRRYDPQRLEMATRDVVSRAVAAQIAAGRRVFLDCRELPDTELAGPLAGFVRLSRRLTGVDVRRELLPVAPAQHYQMGGIAADREGRTTVPGVFAAGECACVSVHGANRIGANSLLETIVIGDACGAAAARSAGSDAGRSLAAAERDARRALDLRPRSRSTSTEDPLARLGALMDESVGVVRSAEPLERALEELSDMEDVVRHGFSGDDDRAWNLALRRRLELENMILLARTIAVGALVRTESRGAHFRSDHPDRAARPMHSEIEYDRGDLRVASAPVEA